MKSGIPSLLISLFIGVCFTASAQSEREFTGKVNNFEITLVGDWQPTSYTDAIGRQKTEFVFRNRTEALLEVSKESLSGHPLANKINTDLEDLKLCYPCVYAGQEAIKGMLEGVRVSLYYFEEGRSTIGTYYYLQDGQSVWILRFSGRVGSPGMARDMTDKMARSFCSVCNF